MSRPYDSLSLPSVSVVFNEQLFLDHNLPAIPYLVAPSCGSISVSTSHIEVPNFLPSLFNGISIILDSSPFNVPAITPQSSSSNYVPVTTSPLSSPAAPSSREQTSSIWPHCPMTTRSQTSHSHSKSFLDYHLYYSTKYPLCTLQTLSILTARSFHISLSYELFCVVCCNA